jgi:hypothetical protein
MTYRTLDLLLLVVAFAGVFAAQQLSTGPATFVSVAICTFYAAFRSAHASGVSPRVVATVAAVLTFWLQCGIRMVVFSLVSNDGHTRFRAASQLVDPPLLFLLVAGATILVGLFGLLVGHYFAMWRDRGWRHLFDRPDG